jgi:hypothetical protein
MPKEVFYFLAIFCLAGGVRLTVILIRGIKQRRNRRRVQQEIANFCEATARGKR